MKLTMQLGSRSYDIILKSGCLANLYQFANVANRKVFILTDSGVPEQYAQTVLAQCPNGMVYTVPQGEASKSLKVYGQVLQAMLEFNMTRKDLLVAVGGGVVGDLGGFCAASYMRGIDFVNCPTTTLSQIDSSIGGKTAIDLGETKNIVGAFWQPKVVLVDFDALATLPRRHFVNGLAEAIKAGEEDLQIYTSGATNIFKYPELSDGDKASRLIDTLEHKEVLQEFVAEVNSGTEEEAGIQVYIGDESPVQSMKDCSVVTANYDLGGGLRGTIGIIGPKRMDYEKVLGTLRNLMNQLDTAFKKDER